MSCSSVFRTVAHCFQTLSLVAFDLVRLAFLVAHSRSALAAENLFLRKQLALFQERKVKPRRADDSTRWMMACSPRKLRPAYPASFVPWDQGVTLLHQFASQALSSAKRKLVATRPPSPGDIHDATRRARNPSPHGTRRAICVCSRCLEGCPGWVSGNPGPSEE